MAHPKVEIVSAGLLMNQEAIEKIKLAKPEILDDKFLKASVPSIYFDGIGDRDYIWMQSYLCHADKPNANKDAFTGGDLYKDVNVSSWRPLVIDINHGLAPAVGITFSAFLTSDESAQTDGLLTTSVIFAWGPYRAVAERMVELAKEDQLRFSMMCYPEYVECGECHKIFNDAADYCVHLKSDFAMRPTRWLRHPTFLANSWIVPPNEPADQFARPLALAGLIGEKELEGLIGQFKPKEKELIQSNKNDQGGHMKTIEQLEAELETVQAQLEAANAKIAQLTADLQSANATLQTKEEVIAGYKEAAEAAKGLEEQVAALTAENTELKTQVEAAEKAEKEARVEARMTEFAGLGLNLTEDELKLVRQQANKADDEWLAYMSIAKKVPNKVDPELQASLESAHLEPGKTKEVAAGSISSLKKIAEQNIKG